MSLHVYFRIMLITWYERPTFGLLKVKNNINCTSYIYIHLHRFMHCLKLIKFNQNQISVLPIDRSKRFDIVCKISGQNISNFDIYWTVLWNHDVHRSCWCVIFFDVVCSHILNIKSLFIQEFLVVILIIFGLFYWTFLRVNHFNMFDLFFYLWHILFNSFFGLFQFPFLFEKKQKQK